MTRIITASDLRKLGKPALQALKRENQAALAASLPGSETRRIAFTNLETLRRILAARRESKPTSP